MAGAGAVTTMLAEHHRRRAKADSMRELGIDPFPNVALSDRQLASEVNAADPEEAQRGSCMVTGRIVKRRARGSVTYLILRDRSGTVRLRVTEGTASDRPGTHPGDWDIGDIVMAAGRPCVLETGETGIDVSSGTLLAKALHVNHGLSHAGHRVHPRELRLMSSDEYCKRIRARARAISTIRSWMHEHDFLEVETPVLQRNASGAVAQPFHTFHNALDRDMTLRLSTQLYLRRCTVGDFERVYEIGRCFRNEGVSVRHSPEFTLLEWSMSYSSYMDSATAVEDLVRRIARATLGSEHLQFRGEQIGLFSPWRRVPLRDVVVEHTGIDVLAEPERLFAEPSARVEDPHAWAAAVHRLYATAVEPRLVQPTVVYDFPLETHPCAKRHPDHSPLAQCFDVVVGGVEIASGGTEISDPDEQRRRFLHQRASSACELLASEEEYVTALTYGAPPSSGVGLGIDRLLMVLLDAKRISDVTLFPALG